MGFDSDKNASAAEEGAASYSNTKPEKMESDHSNSVMDFFHEDELRVGPSNKTTPASKLRMGRVSSTITSLRIKAMSSNVHKSKTSASLDHIQRSNEGQGKVREIADLLNMKIKVTLQQNETPSISSLENENNNSEWSDVSEFAETFIISILITNILLVIN